MSRNNNTARSLIIMSKLQGWDPTRIEGFEGQDLGYREDIPTRGTVGWVPPVGGPPDVKMQSMPAPPVEHNQAGSGGSGSPGTGVSVPGGGGEGIGEGGGEGGGAFMAPGE